MFGISHQKDLASLGIIQPQPRFELVLRPSVAQHLQGKGEGTTIGVIVDHDSGSLSFRVNGSHLLPACSSLEKNASLLPWVSLVFRQDSVGFVSRYVRTGLEPRIR